MNKDTLGVVTMTLTVGVLGVFCGCLITIDSADKRVVNQLCQKQQYDFCEIDTYKMKGDSK